MITSTNNEIVKLVRSLEHRKYREATGLVYVEGLRSFEESLDLENDLEMVLVAPSLMTKDMERIVQVCQGYGTRIIEVADSILQTLSGRDKPDGLAAVVRQRWYSLDTLKPTSADFCWIALQSIREPRNLGAILRVSDAVGAAGVILLDDSTDPYSPFAVRASTGAVFSQGLVRASFDQFREWLRVHSCPCIGTSEHGDTDYTAVTYPQPMVLLMGSERAGLTSAQESICDALVRIPMIGHVKSLNVAVATGILLYEALKQGRQDRASPSSSPE